MITTRHCGYMDNPPKTTPRMVTYQLGECLLSRGIDLDDLKQSREELCGTMLLVPH